MAAAAGRVSFEKLSRRHGIKIAPEVSCSVEECALAVGEIVGYNSVVSASRMSGAVVVFLDEVEKVKSMVQNGAVVQGMFAPVTPLIRPARKITLSNVPPFIKDKLLTAELLWRQIYMILKNGIDEVNVAFKFRIDDFDYVVFATSDTMKCFGCGQEGHLRRSCPEKPEEGPSQASASGPMAGDAGQTSDTEAGPSPAEQRTADPGQTVRLTRTLLPRHRMGKGLVQLNLLSALTVRQMLGNKLDAGADVGCAAAISAVGNVLGDESMDTEVGPEESVFKAPLVKGK
ncbi:hypothetical protein AOLI_G00004200 [Acnodon oligacanthus]